MPHILLIDDDERLGDLLGQFFRRYEYDYSSVTLPGEGLARIADGNIDLVILDVMLPEMDGFEVCKTIRKSSDVPIIMLTARGDVMDRIVGLELGADDYLPKPFEPRELLARVQTVLKRSDHRKDDGEVLRYGELTVEPALRQATLSGESIALSSGEYRLLELLAKHPGKTFSRDEIMNRLRGSETEIYSRAIDITISRLRQKLKPGEFIKTVHGRGYCFVGNNR